MPNEIASAWSAVVDLLRQSSVEIHGAALGTGFFVAPNAIVTCAHVIGTNAQVEVRPHGEGEPLKATVVETLAGSHEDIALLNIDGSVTSAIYPLLDDRDDAAPGDELLVFGFPKYFSGEEQRSDTLNARFAGETGFVDDPGFEFHKFKGDRVVGGFSGSPLLNLRTGRIIGIVDETIDAKSEAGGWAVRTRFVLERFPALAEANRQHADPEQWMARIEALRKWRAIQEGTPQPPLELDTHESDSSGMHRFLYRTRMVQFRGRAEEIKTLNAFLTDERRFLWLTLTGSGGAGKSRLALEFCLQTQKARPEWRVGFLPREAALSDLNAWLPNQPTFIVADYVAGRADGLGNAVRRLCARSRDFLFPVRVLLLERTNDGPWVSRFLGAGSDRQTIESAQYRYTARRDEKADPYDTAPKVDALELSSLGEDELWESIQFLVNESRSTEKLGPGDRARVMKQLRELDPSGSPLFAAFLADAIADNRDSRRWDKEALVQDVIAREEQNFWGPAGVAENEKDLLALATLSRGIDLTRDDVPQEIKDWLKTRDARDHYAVMSGHAVDVSLAAMKPDILGELFVLNHLERTWACDDRAIEARQTAWRVNAKGISEFLMRASLDFPDHKALWVLGECPTQESLGRRLRWLEAAYYLLPACINAEFPPETAIAWQTELWRTYEELLSSPLTAIPSLERFAAVLSATFVRIGAADIAIAVYDAIIARFGEANEPALRERVAMALVNKGLRLGRLGRSEEAIVAYDALTERFADATEPALREQVARALFSKGEILGQLGRSKEAIEAYDALTERFADASEPAVREQVAGALINKGITLGQLGRSEESIEAYDAVVAKFADASEPLVREQVAMALFNKGITLGCSEEAIAAYDAVVAKFADASEPAVREQVAMALVNKGGTLGKLDRFEEAIGAYGAVDEKFADASEPAVREQVAKALFNKGAMLGRLGRSKEAIAAYNEATARFEGASEPFLRELVARTLVNKGAILGRLERSAEAETPRAN
jgi:tetratricopeptide (TPR) repeat protein